MSITPQRPGETLPTHESPTPAPFATVGMALKWMARSQKSRKGSTAPLPEAVDGSVAEGGSRRPSYSAASLRPGSRRGSLQGASQPSHELLSTISDRSDFTPASSKSDTSERRESPHEHPTNLTLDETLGAAAQPADDDHLRPRRNTTRRVSFVGDADADADADVEVLTRTCGVQVAFPFVAHSTGVRSQGSTPSATPVDTNATTRAVQAEMPFVSHGLGGGGAWQVSSPEEEGEQQPLTADDDRGQYVHLSDPQAELQRGGAPGPSSADLRVLPLARRYSSGAVVAEEEAVPGRGQKNRTVSLDAADLPNVPHLARTFSSRSKAAGSADATKPPPKRAWFQWG